VALAREVYAIAAAQRITPEPFDAWQADAFALDAPPDRTRTALADFCGWLYLAGTGCPAPRDRGAGPVSPGVAPGRPIMVCSVLESSPCSRSSVSWSRETGVARDNLVELERAIVHSGGNVQCHTMY
jgi:hypothetical protein